MVRAAVPGTTVDAASRAARGRVVKGYAEAGGLATIVTGRSGAANPRPAHDPAPERSTKRQWALTPLPSVPERRRTRARDGLRRSMTGAEVGRIVVPPAFSGRESAAVRIGRSSRKARERRSSRSGRERAPPPQAPAGRPRDSGRKRIRGGAALPSGAADDLDFLRNFRRRCTGLPVRRRRAPQREGWPQSLPRAAGRSRNFVWECAYRPRTAISASRWTGAGAFGPWTAVSLASSCRLLTRLRPRAANAAERAGRREPSPTRRGVPRGRDARARRANRYRGP